VLFRSNRLSELTKKRLPSCLAKFMYINPNERGVHRMLLNMNKNITHDMRAEERKKSNNSKFQQWFIDLEEMVSLTYKQDDSILKLLLDKICQFGKLTSKKMDETAFFKILETLRIWELLSPDVMSAVEFCRERIVEVKIDEFDIWFQSKHPQAYVARPESTKGSKTSKPSSAKKE